MQIAPVAAVASAFADSVSGMAPQQQIAAGAATQADGQAAAKIETLDRGAAIKAGAAPDPTRVEHELFQYLMETGNFDFSAQAADPTALARKVLDALGGATGKFQQAYERAQGGLLSATDNIAPPQSSEAASPLQAEDSRSSGNDRKIEQMLQHYISFSWAAFGASLATSGVTAANSSINTLVKQQ